MNQKEIQDKLIYWMQERYKIRYLKDEAKIPAPWSKDPVFQNTYFCNVHREDDRVTKWIRANVTIERFGENIEYAMVLARFLNWPDTLYSLLILSDVCGSLTDLGWLQDKLEYQATAGHKVWGNAYVITSHGMKMPKVEYLCQHLLRDVLAAMPAIQAACKRAPEHHMSAVENGQVATPALVPGTCASAARALQAVQGIGSFLAGQIVADLKNTIGHPLYSAPDKRGFVVSGPGSIRGLNWWHFGKPEGSVNERTFQGYFDGVRCFVDASPSAFKVDNQDLQNCLCEYDKYLRVLTGTGKSKRSYPGA